MPCGTRTTTSHYFPPSTRVGVGVRVGVRVAVGVRERRDELWREGVRLLLITTTFASEAQLGQLAACAQSIR